MRWALSWLFYWIGDTSCRLIGDRPEFVVNFFFRLYQRSMNISSRIQGDGKGPWGPIRQGREE